MSIVYWTKLSIGGRGTWHSSIKNPNAISPSNKFHLSYDFATNIKLQRILYQITPVNYPLSYNLKHMYKQILKSV